MMGQKPTKATLAPATTAPEAHSAPRHDREESHGHPMPWDYREEPDVIPAEKPTEATPAPAPTLPEGHSAPRHDHGETHAQPMPWDYQEEPDVDGGAS